MENRIALESRGKKPSEVRELILDNCKATTVDGLTDDFINLETLSLINVGLTSLRHFPKLPKLRKLDLSENRISGGLQHLAGCSRLTTLSLSNNRIKNLDALEFIRELKELKSLDMYLCEVTTTEDYRDKVFKLLPQLQWLDNANIDGQAESESEESSDESVASSDIEDGDGGDEEGGSELDAGNENEEEEDEEEEEEDGPGLAYLQKSNLVDDDDDDEEGAGDFQPEDDADSEDIDDDADADVDVRPVSYGGKGKGKESGDDRRKHARGDDGEVSESKRER
eukprot:m.10816 g.10816  ORF g.10816 m.10816 type:complete len:282 (+) comp22709_c0_seq2:409-1254(+)